MQLTTKNIVRTISLILLVGLFCVIFAFSNQNSEESSGLSKKVTEAVLSHISYVQNLDDASKQDVYETAEKIVRKLAHLSIYTLVGILAAIFTYTYTVPAKAQVTVSALIGAAYATLDELHQTLIPGRTGRLGDVALDTIGVLIGICLVFMIIAIYQRIKSIAH